MNTIVNFSEQVPLQPAKMSAFFIGKFAQLCPAVVRCPRLSYGARTLYCILNSYIIGELPRPGSGYFDKDAFMPLQEDLAADMGCSVRSVQKYQKELEAAGLLIAVPTREGNVYRFPEPVETLTGQGWLEIEPLPNATRAKSAAVPVRPYQQRPAGLPHDSNLKKRGEAQHVSHPDTQHDSYPNTQHVAPRLYTRESNRESIENHHPLTPSNNQQVVVAAAPIEISCQSIKPNSVTPPVQDSALTEKDRVIIQEVCTRLEMKPATAEQLVRLARRNGHAPDDGYIHDLVDYVLTTPKILRPKAAFVALVKRDEERTPLVRAVVGVGGNNQLPPSTVPACSPLEALLYQYRNVSPHRLPTLIQLEQRNLKAAQSEQEQAQIQLKLEAFTALHAKASASITPALELEGAY